MCGAHFGVRPPMIDSSDVLPLPLGPMSASSSPGRQHPVMLRRICNAIGKVKQHVGSVDRSVARHLCGTSTAMKEQQTQKLSITAHLQTCTRSQFESFGVQLGAIADLSYAFRAVQRPWLGTQTEDNSGETASRDVYVYDCTEKHAVIGLTACLHTLACMFARPAEHMLEALKVRCSTSAITLGGVELPYTPPYSPKKLL